MVSISAPARRRFLLAAAVAAIASGCGSCQEPELAPRAPVEGRLPFPPKRPTVLATPPRQACAVFGFPSADGGRAPLELRFEAEGDCSEGKAVYSWSFGDGSPQASGDLVLHTYEKPGTYHGTVRVTSTANATLSDSDNFEIVVTSADAGNAESESPED